MAVTRREQQSDRQVRSRPAGGAQDPRGSSADPFATVKQRLTAPLAGLEPSLHSHTTCASPQEFGRVRELYPDPSAGACAPIELRSLTELIQAWCAFRRRDLLRILDLPLCSLVRGDINVLHARERDAGEASTQSDAQRGTYCGPML
ncbi:unnamed protein product [Pleuronectes platessa]|uniref:Uncharacterized protein n=1 Tax=Pleuronectes platessa TaxID=8262 RepID=A0A9N7Y7Y2_PLEPL|nr:unnamed protein product [Pleuronectes platessa]